MATRISRRWTLTTALLLTTALGGAWAGTGAGSSVFAGIATAGPAMGEAVDAGTVPAMAPSVARLHDPGFVGRAVCRRPEDREALIEQRRQLAAATGSWGDLVGPDAPPLRETVGAIGYPVTTASELAQAFFDQGLAFAYGFNHAEALRAFRTAQELDPSCAMCAWGEALVLGPNLNAPMDPGAVAPAVAAVTRAQELAGNASPREQALIAALATRYAEGPDADRRQLDAAYADAMAGVYERFPDDQDIAVLFAAAAMNTQPWDYWEADAATPKGRAGPAVAALEGVLAENPDHIGAAHYYIHIVEASSTPERAEPYADRLAAQRDHLAGLGHLVHMPSHIYFRVGRYKDSLEANRAAVAADEAFIAEGDASLIYAGGYFPHNVHFLLESARLAGDAATTLAQAERLPGIVPTAIIEAVPWVQLIVASPYFAHAQFAEPADALAVTPPDPQFPYLTAMWHYMRGVAFVRAGDAAAAHDEAAAIAGIRAETDFSAMVNGGVPATDLLDLAGHIVEGRIARAAGDHDAAIGHFEAAVAIQDALPYLEPPYWYYPVRQSLGGALLAAGRAEEAERVFWRSLLDFPQNGWALAGLTEAHRMQGNAAAAAVTEALFRRAWAGDPEGPDLAGL